MFFASLVYGTSEGIKNVVDSSDGVSMSKNIVSLLGWYGEFFLFSVMNDNVLPST